MGFNSEISANQGASFKFINTNLPERLIELLLSKQNKNTLSNLTFHSDAERGKKTTLKYSKLSVEINCFSFTSNYTA